MINFDFFTPTKILFGAGRESEVGKQVAAFGGHKVMIVYGKKGGHIETSGLLERVHKSLRDAGLSYVDLNGVVPNPRLSLVKEGIRIGRAEDIDFLLPIGGGSVIDTAKGIGYGIANDFDMEDLLYGRVKTDKNLPIGVVLTIAAAGSEMSSSMVLTIEDGMMKRSYGHDCSRPKFAIMNPELTYSLPTYQTVWNPDAFFKTTIIPVVLMLVVNLIVIIKMMRHTPLQFLRHDLKKTKRKKAMRLPKWSFLSRFRLRIMFQNVTNYLILFVGIWFIGIMLAMAVGMPETLDYYKSNVSDMMFTNYQYVLKSYENEDGDIITTDNKDAEKFNMTSLQHKSDTLDEEISVYGIEDDSRYVKISDLSALKGNEAYISASYADKYSLSVGDTVVLDEKYENKQYEFEVAGIYDHSQALAVFLSNEQYCEIFDMDSDAFTGYLSDSEITDIDEDEIATVITEHDITKMCDQLDHSMGSYMTYFQYLCILLSAVLIYLLTKLIIEKNENAISMTKILGYENREIASLYLLSTTIVLVVIDVASVILGVVIMKAVWRIMLFSYSGWYAFRISTMGYVKMFLFILIGYLLVMVLDFRRIKRIPMDQALKNVE